MAVRARQPAPPVHGRRWLGAAPAVGHGHRELRRHRRRLPGGLPHEPGPEHPPDAARRAGPADLPRPREPAGDRGHAAGDRRRPAAVDGVAPGVPGRQQRRVHGPVRVQGQRQRRCPTTRRRTRATCSSASPTARTCRPSRRRASRTSTAGRGAALVDLNLDGLLDLVEVNLGAPVRVVAERRRRDGRRAGADGQLGRVPAPPARRQPGRHRRGRRDAGRRHGHRAPRDGRRRRPHQRPARAGPRWASGRRPRPSCASRGRTASRAHGSACRPTGLRSSSVARPRPSHGRRAARTGGG